MKMRFLSCALKFKLFSRLKSIRTSRQRTPSTASKSSFSNSSHVTILINKSQHATVLSVLCQPPSKTMVHQSLTPPTRPSGQRSAQTQRNCQMEKTLPLRVGESLSGAYCVPTLTTFQLKKTKWTTSLAALLGRHKSTSCLDLTKTHLTDSSLLRK